MNKHTETLIEFLNDPGQPIEEKLVIKWQFDRALGSLSGFTKALWAVIIRADDENLERLERGFPEYVRAFRQWNRGDMADRLTKKGISL